MDFKLPHIGQFFLGISWFLSLMQLVWLSKKNAAATANRLSIALFISTLCAFIILLTGHMLSDFNFLNVIMHSHTQKPFLYKISGTWGNHEGSMMLFLILLTTFGAAFINFLKKRNSPLLILSAMFISIICFYLINFLIMACDPFAIVDSPPMEGRDLNPLLQDPSLAIHPPMLYTGYTGFLIPFVFTLSALLKKSINRTWAKQVYGWAIIAWTFLTIGLSLGSFWAYYELGWGGWWFWDPVENAALMPWLLSTSLIHALRVNIKQDIQYGWSVFLSLLTFCFCLFGLFLVRSGLLTSVHSFAIDPSRGIWLSSLVLLVGVISLTIFILQKKYIPKTTLNFSALSRTHLILANNILFTIGSGTILLGTLYPLLLDFLGHTITVGAPYFNATLFPMMWPVLILMGYAYPATWRLQKITWNMVSIHLMIAMILFFNLLPLKIYYDIDELLFGTLWSTIYSLILLLIKRRRKKDGTTFSIQLIKKSPIMLAHGGICVAIFGMVLSTIFEKEYLESVQEGKSINFNGYELTLDKVTKESRSNHEAIIGNFYIKSSPQDRSSLIKPEKRYYWTQSIIHPETAIYRHWLNHVHVILGDEYKDKMWSVKIYERPYILLLWIGAIMIAIGGMIGLVRHSLYGKKYHEISRNL